MCFSVWSVNRFLQFLHSYSCLVLNFPLCLPLFIIFLLVQFGHLVVVFSVSFPFFIKLPFKIISPKSKQLINFNKVRIIYYYLYFSKTNRLQPSPTPSNNILTALSLLTTNILYIQLLIYFKKTGENGK